MANPYFQFKQFRIDQDQCGMKVCTDACILGAYANKADVHSILDIGSGTGLLSLMLAQRHPMAMIDAVELEKNAYEQACRNVQNSPWADRIQLFHHSIQAFTPPKKYDLIICNPPFYPDHLQSAAPQRRQAFHQETMRFPDLIEAVLKLLDPSGAFSLLLPGRQAEDFTLLAAKAGLFVQKELQFFETKASGKFRSIRIFGFRQPEAPPVEKLIIRSENGSYSHEFQQLLQPYYIIF